jgi:hypothetical protein
VIDPDAEPLVGQECGDHHALRVQLEPRRRAEHVLAADHVDDPVVLELYVAAALVRRLVARVRHELFPLGARQSHGEQGYPRPTPAQSRRGE